MPFVKVANLSALAADSVTEVLVDEYRKVNEEIRALEKGKGFKEVQDIRQEHEDLYKKKDALHSEISEREAKKREQ